jgi:hypothetical protein
MNQIKNLALIQKPIKKKPKPKQIEKELEQQIKPPKIKNNERKKHQKTK